MSIWKSSTRTAVFGALAIAALALSTPNEALAQQRLPSTNLNNQQFAAPRVAPPAGLRTTTLAPRTVRTPQVGVTRNQSGIATNRGGAPQGGNQGRPSAGPSGGAGLVAAGGLNRGGSAGLVAAGGLNRGGAAGVLSHNGSTLRR